MLIFFKILFLRMVLPENISPNYVILLNYEITRRKVIAIDVLTKYAIFYKDY